MVEMSIGSLVIHGYQGRDVPNRLFKQAGQADTLAVIFPGLNYSADMPLLFYPAELLRQRGADVLQLHTDYTVVEYQTAPLHERLLWLLTDAGAAIQAAQTQSQYKHLLLIGKSIGTLVLAQLVTAGFASEAITIWLTPLLHQPFLVASAERCQSPALFIAGTHDSTYDAEALEKIQQAPGAKTLVIEGANHSLQIPHDVFASLRVMERVLQEIDRFLEQQLKPK